jgi:hypothetical protein
MNHPRAPVIPAGIAAPHAAVFDLRRKEVLMRQSNSRHAVPRTALEERLRSVRLRLHLAKGERRAERRALDEQLALAREPAEPDPGDQN